ncbi:HAD family hydrolase [Methanobacterium paludis]|uniref:Haloacid dehalogenase domain protein hydrolase n=1 Tax=Methanobacterium paludis (strain DSM 25820 / JCM 18151 / SWAN1) TaxID=868131 RepID=F6D7D9_METPW|nr:HAD family hydrolase [Methanobacterium paludis]AEG17081.1 Haloacid dehalogenase domain protein hydrolase [Methanobacterium paludis]
MKAIVFDNSGTLIERYRALKYIKTGAICDDVSSIDIVDYDNKRALVVLQTDPSKCIRKARPDQTIHHFLKKNLVKFDISYSAADVDKTGLLDILKDDKALIKDLQDTLNAVIEKKYNVQICSGSGFIANTEEGKIEFTITSGGRVFKEVPEVINELKDRGIEIFVASGDRQGSLQKLAEYVGIPEKNVFGTADTRRKMEIVKNLKKNYKVMMVGNDLNDILALKEADIGVLTLQQDKNVSKRVYDAADFVVENIKEILKIDF